MTRFVLALFGALFSLGTAAADRKPLIEWETAVRSIEAKVEPAEAKPGQPVAVTLTVRLFPDHWTYPTKQTSTKDKASHNRFVLPAPGDLVFIGPFPDPADAHKKEGPDGALYYPDTVTWSFKAVVAPTATPGERAVRIKLDQFLVCNDDTCFPPGRVPVKDVAATFKVLGGSADLPADLKSAVEQGLASPKPILLPVPDPPAPDPVRAPKEAASSPSPEAAPVAVSFRITPGANHESDLANVRSQLPDPQRKSVGFWVFIGTAAFWGIVTLMTPCVFPMIPITVSIFVKQGEKQGISPLRHALVYASTIVVLLTIAALTLLTVFGRLAVHPVTNVLLGVLFVTLALSLFGLFELTLPSFLADMTGRKAGQGGYLGTVFMAASFTVISFTCVAPFLGGFAGLANSKTFSYPQLAAGALAFAMAFASPFFLLALFPSLLKKLPKSGDWMNMIKVSMGFLELAAALKFFRTAELRWLTPPEYFTYDFVLALWVAIFAAMALYLFGLFRTRHDHEAHDHVGPVRVLFGLGAVGLAVYLTPALFSAGNHERNRPAGVVYAWVDAFLLPEPRASTVIGGESPWSADLKRALDEARPRGGRVFVDFTGETCSNCRYNEENVFVKPEVKELFKQYILVQIYTDVVPNYFYENPPDRSRRNADGLANLDFQEDAFGDVRLPMYVILKPEVSGKTTVVGIYEESKIDNPAAFVQFLKDGLK
jgi:thiol:disulfide interchange protein